MAIDIIGSSAATTTAATTAKKANELGKDDFLKLLITQLSNQDPMKPMDDTQFISQLAQFSSLEQMQQVNTGLGTISSTLQPFLQNSVGFSAASWVGRSISAKDSNPPKDSNGNLVDPLTDADGNVVVGTDGKPSARNLNAKVESVLFTEEGPIMKIKVTQKFQDINTGTVVDREVEKNVPLSDIYSVS